MTVTFWHCLPFYSNIFLLFLIFHQNSSSLHCFAFADADFSPKTDVVRGPAPAGAKGAALTIHTLSLKGRKDPVSASLLTICVDNVASKCTGRLGESAWL